MTNIENFEKIEKQLKKLYKELEKLEAPNYCLESLKEAYGNVGLALYFKKNPKAFR